MVDETTISDYSTNSTPVYRITAENGKTILRDYSTNAPRFVINGEIGGGTAKAMTTAQRTAITPKVGELIFDTNLGVLFVGDGATAGGNAVGGGGGGVVPGYRLTDDGTSLNFNPVQPIVNVTGNSVTLAPDTAYKIYATTGAFNVTANPPAANYWGLEGHAEIFVGSVGYVVFDTSKIVLANQLEPDSVNNCTLRFHDGMCYISVEDHVAGYIVVNGSTAGSGSLYYGIATSTNDYVAFDASLNGTTIPLAGAVAEGEKHVVGNGYTETAITGAVNCGTSKFTVANLSLSNVSVNGGTMTLGDVYIPSGSTVAVSGGGLAVEKVTGAGGVIDGGHTRATVAHGGIASGVTFSNFTGGATETQPAINLQSNAILSSCTITGGTGAGVYGGAFGQVTKRVAYIIDCVISGNDAGITSAGPIEIAYGGTVSFAGCQINDRVGLLERSCCAIFTGSNHLLNRVNPYWNGAASGAMVKIEDGATLDLTGNTNPTPIAPGGGVVVDGGCTVITSAGASVSIAGGTYTKIKNDGTTE